MERYKKKFKEADETKYAVVMLGGSIGNKSIRKVSDLKGTEVKDKDRIFDSIDKAKEKAKQMNKLLSPGEKTYYGLKYVVAKIENNKFVGE